MLAYLVLYSLISFTVALLAFPVLIKLLFKWRLFDIPGHHKIHISFKPSMGGVCIMLGVVLTLFISFPFEQWVIMKYFFVALAIIFITGLRDDILTLTPLQKLLGQLLPIVILVVFSNVSLQSLYEINPITFPVWLGWTLTIFTFVILTNAYNLIDGLDGLAGTIAVIVLTFLGSWFFLTNNYYYSVLAFSFVGALVAFLVFNWQPSRIFMGDTGTLAVGFVISYLVINFINLNYSLSKSHDYHFTSSISTAFMILIIPVFDTTRVIIVRLRKLHSPFRADRNHLHHQFISLGFSHAQTTVLMAVINGIFILLACLLKAHSDIVILPLILVICLIINWILEIAVKKRQNYSGE